MSEVSIQLENLSIGYETKGSVKTVAANINASICRGQLTCLLGANGVGKSTLLRTLSNFQPMLSGRIMIDGKDISTMTDLEVARTIGVVLTERPNIENMTVEEMVSLGRSPYTGFWGRLNAEDRQQVANAITTVGIELLRGRMVNTLSDGERQKVMLAKALAQQTPVILLDEPTAFLDFPSKVETMMMLKRICREAGKTVFLSTHDLELALQTADMLWLMSHEKRLEIGTPKELAANGALSQFIERPGIRFDRESLTVIIIENWELKR